jgi:hypothetical protein
MWTAGTLRLGPGEVAAPDAGQGGQVGLEGAGDRAPDGTFVSDWDYLVVTAEKR